MTPTDDAVRTHSNRPGPVSHRLVRRGLVPAAAVVGLVGAMTVPVAAATKPVVTSAKIPGLGTVLESGQRPLYVWANDPRGRSTCTGGCATIWPPLIVSSKAAHHLGRFSGLGTIHRSKGVLQAAIHGHALYFFEGDHTKSHAGGQGVASFFTVHTNGTLVHSVNSAPLSTVPSTSQPASSPSSSTTTRPTSAPNHSTPTSPPPTNPPSTTPTTAPAPPPTTTTYVPPTTTTTTTTAPSGGGVGF